MRDSSIHRDRINLANWREFPASRYSFQHVSEFVPVAMIGATGMPEENSPGSAMLKNLRLRDRGGGEIMALAHFERSYADHVVILRDGALIAEWYASGVDPFLPHLVFSISKSITGLLAGIAAGQGLLDPDAAVTDYVPSMAGSAYGAVQVRDLLDMTVNLDFDEEYLDDGGAFDRYRRAMLWNPERPQAPEETMEAFLATLRSSGRDMEKNRSPDGRLGEERSRPGSGPEARQMQGGQQLQGDEHRHGKVHRHDKVHARRFYYASPNSDLLGLVIERAVGVRYHQYLAEKLWQPMGARGGAYVTVDRAGTARAAGGVCVTTRDLARLGQLVLDHGRSHAGEQIVPHAWIDDIKLNGDRDAWVNGNFAAMFINGRYRSCWYDVGDRRGTIAAVGIHGQWLWCDPTSRVVIARTSCHPIPSDDDDLALEIRMLSQIARAFDDA